MCPSPRNCFASRCCVAAALCLVLVVGRASPAYGLAADYGPEELKQRGSIGEQAPVHGYWVNWEDTFFYAGNADAQPIHRGLWSVQALPPGGGRSPRVEARRVTLATDRSSGRLVAHVWNTGVPLVPLVRGNKKAEEIELQPVGEPAPTRVDVWVGQRLQLHELHIPVTLKVVAASDAVGDEEINAFIAGRGIAKTPDKTPPQEVARHFRVTVELTDGSRLKGDAPALDDLTLNTSVGKVSIPADQIDVIQFASEGSPLTVRLKNDDRLTGKLETDGWQVKLSTVIGDITIPGRLLRQCIVEGPFQKAQVSVRANGSWESNVADKAFDGCGDTYWNAGTYAPAWIEADLGRSTRLASILLLPVQDIAGETTHEIWISDEPIGENQANARLVHRFHGPTGNQQPLKLDFPKDLSARYVQIRSTQSPTWIAWCEIEILVGQ